ncbi:MAG: TIGR02147 family protein [Bdellovibrionia bacterium]
MLVEHLRTELGKRCRKNPNYSLRAFARALKIDSSSLSAILNEKRRVSPKIAKKLLDELGVDQGMKQKIISSMVGLEDAAPPAPEFVELEMEKMRVIADWEHFAILALLETDECKHSVTWIANKLDIGTGTVLEALNRLEKTGLLKKENGKWLTTGASLSTATDVPEPALRRHHQQYIEKALFSLENHSVEERDITGITMAVDPRRLPEAKKMIRLFRRQLCKFLEGGTQDRVYRINLQLFPIDRS